MVGFHEGSKHSVEIRNALHKCKKIDQTVAFELGIVILYKERKISMANLQSNSVATL